MNRYVIRITHPCFQVTEVGVRAESETEAYRLAIEAIESGVQEDTEHVHWLDQSTVSYPADSKYTCSSLSTFGDAIGFPQPSGSIKYDRKSAAALDLCRHIASVYADAEESQHISWEDMDEIHRRALEILGR